MEPLTPTPNNQNPTILPNQPAAPVTPAVPDALNASATPKAPIGSKPSLFKQWYFWAMIGVSIFGLLGIGFGAYELNEAITAQDQVAKLESDMAEKNQLLVRYGKELGYRLDDFGRPLETPDNNSTKTIRYIPVDDWGVKFRIPDNLYNVSYVYQILPSTDPKLPLASSLCLTGTLRRTRSLPVYADLDYNRMGLGCISRLTDGTTDESGELVYEYRISAPQEVISTDEKMIQEELETVPVIRKMLTEGRVDL